MEYEFKVVFEADRELTEAELDIMASAVLAQVQEPVDAEGSDATYTTSNCSVTLSTDQPGLSYTAARWH
jgi:hypothetical protein